MTMSFKSQLGPESMILRFCILKFMWMKNNICMLADIRPKYYLIQSRLLFCLIIRFPVDVHFNMQLSLS